jgi:hypothetical protein
MTLAATASLGARSFYAGSVSFAAPTETAHVVLPPDSTAIHVSSKYTDVSASISLQIKAAGSVAAPVAVSESSAAPTSLGAMAGGAVIFSVSGMSGSASVAVFGVRLA